jgi:hypothetical protein
MLQELVREERSGRPAPNAESYRIGVAGLAAKIILENGESLSASFYLRLSSMSGPGRETLGERLNDPATRFLPCKVDGQIELVNLARISHVLAHNPLPEVSLREQMGAMRRRAKVHMHAGLVLEGDFLHILPDPRSRLSDLLNLSDERFLLFLTRAAHMYVNRTQIVRVVP